jgi:MFS family permease
VLLGIYCFFLPKTPPSTGREPFAAKEAMQEIMSKRALLVVFLIAFPIACVHQFYFLQTAPFLNSPQIRVDAAFINNIFGVGGSGLMTIGQISEIVMLALVPLMAKQFSRKTFLVLGLLAYILRFFIFAYIPHPWAVIPALALHGLCFGFFFFICFMIVDELTTRDVRASAQGLFNLVLVGLGTIVGNLLTGYIGQLATRPDRTVDFRLLFSVPMWITVVCLAALIVLYPNRSAVRNPEGLAAA